MEDLLKYLIAFILGWIIARMIGDGFSVGGELAQCPGRDRFACFGESEADCANTFIHTRDSKYKCVWHRPKYAPDHCADSGVECTTTPPSTPSPHPAAPTKELWAPRPAPHPAPRPAPQPSPQSAAGSCAAHKQAQQILCDLSTTQEECEVDGTCYWESSGTPHPAPTPGFNSCKTEMEPLCSQYKDNMAMCSRCALTADTTKTPSCNTPMDRIKYCHDKEDV